jgi:hypothetical protein
MERAEIRDSLLRDLERELHDLCQPVSTLQCLLEYGQMCGTPEELLLAVESGLVETVRIFRCIEAMRGRILQGNVEQHGDAGGVSGVNEWRP